MTSRSPSGESPAIGTSHRLAEPKSLSREDIAAITELRDVARSAKNLLISDLEEPGRTIFWRLVDALSKADTILVGWGLEEDSSRSLPSDRRADALSVGLDAVRAAVESVTGIPDAIRNLTPIQVALLRRIAKNPEHVPYGDAHASALLLGGYAERAAAFGKLAITPDGRRALGQ